MNQELQKQQFSQDAHIINKFPNIPDFSKNSSIDSRITLNIKYPPSTYYSQFSTGKEQFPENSLFQNSQEQTFCQEEEDHEMNDSEEPSNNEENWNKIYQSFTQGNQPNQSQAVVEPEINREPPVTEQSQLILSSSDSTQVPPFSHIDSIVLYKKHFEQKQFQECPTQSSVQSHYQNIFDQHAKKVFYSQQYIQNMHFPSDTSDSSSISLSQPNFRQNLELTTMNPEQSQTVFYSTQDSNAPALTAIQINKILAAQKEDKPSQIDGWRSPYSDEFSDIDNAYRFSQATVGDYYFYQGPKTSNGIQETSCKKPLGRDNRPQVLLENNDQFKKVAQLQRNHQQFAFYTDQEIGLTSAMFEDKLVDSRADEDCDTDSEVLFKTNKICNRDMQELRYLMQQNPHSLPKYINNFQQYVKPAIQKERREAMFKNDHNH